MGGAFYDPGVDLSGYAKIGNTGTPAGVGPASAGLSQLAAPADHVHPFGPNFQRARIAAAATTTWTFNPAFAAGVVPVIGCLVESPAGGPVFQEPQITSVDNTQVTLALKCQAATLTISLGSLTLFGTAIPANTFLHLSARNPNA